MPREQVGSDNFDRADSDPMSGNWAQKNDSSSRVKIVSNKIQASHTAWASALYTLASPNDDQYVSLVLSGLGSTNSGMGVCARMSPDTNAARDNYSYRMEDTSPRTTKLVRTNNGTETVLDTTTSVTWANGDRIEIECEGSIIRGLKNGVEQIEVDDGTPITTGDAGVTARNAGTNINGDDFEFGNMTAGEPPSLEEGITRGIFVLP